MNVIGVDSSLTLTGWAGSIDGTLSSGRYSTETTTGSLRELRDRVRYITGAVLLGSPRPLLSVIEKPIIPQHGAGQVLERAWLFGLLVDQLMVRGPVVEVHQATRTLYAAGHGAADKDQVLAAMRSRLPQLDIPDHNVADAAALMCMGLRWKGVPIDGALTKDQLRAMRTPVWPTGKEEQQ